jgi:hypothetical protein
MPRALAELAAVIYLRRLRGPVSFGSGRLQLTPHRAVDSIWASRKNAFCKSRFLQ